MELDELRAQISEIQRVMIDVATHRANIDDENAAYMDRHRRVAADLRHRGLEDPNPHGDLWEWYTHWKNDPTLGGYAERRVYVRRLYAPLLDALDHLEERQLGTALVEALPGWDRVDSQVRQLRERYATARTTEDFQAIGLLARDIFVSLADATFDPQAHLAAGEDEPTSAKERLKLVVGCEAPGGSNEKLRKALNGVLDFANAVQHDRAATLNKAAIVAEATIASVNVLRFLVVGAEPIEAQPDDGDDDLSFLFEPEDDPRDEDWYRDR